jgi:hypothetical protein
MGDSTVISIPANLGSKAKSQASYTIPVVLGIGYLIYNKKTRKVGLLAAGAVAFLLTQVGR